MVKRRRKLTVDIAKPTGLALLRMMETTGPIDSNVTLLTVKPGGAFHTPTGTDPAELKKPIENGTVVSNVESTLFFLVGLHIIRSDFLQEFDVLISVKLGHLMV